MAFGVNLQMLMTLQKSGAHFFIQMQKMVVLEIVGNNAGQMLFKVDNDIVTAWSTKIIFKIFILNYF